MNLEPCEKINSVQEQDFFTGILDSIAALVMILDLKGRILHVNQACEILTGYSVSEIKGRNIEDLLVSREDQATESAFFQDATGNIRDSFNGPILTRSGEKRLISWKNSVLAADSGTIPRIIATGVDISSALSVKEELQRTIQTQGVLNELLHLSLENIPLPEILNRFIHHITSFPWLMIEPQGAVFVMDTRSNSLKLIAHRNLAPQLLTMCARVSLGTCLCGRAAERKEILFADCIDEEHDVRFAEMRPHGHYCIPILSAAKELLGVFTLYVKEKSVRDPQAEEIFRAAASVVAGVIERKKAEEALIESEERYRIITETASDAIIMLDTNDAINFWNPAAAMMFGYTASDIAGKTINSLLDFPSYEEAVDGKKVMSLLDAHEKKILESEMVGIRSDGSRFPVEISLTRLSIGRQWGGIARVRDITRRKEAEREKIRLETRFLQAQKMEAVGQLAGGVAHDFNNLLTGIIGFAEIALEEIEKGSPLHDDISEVVSLSHKASDLTRQLLAFSRRQSLIPEELNLNSLISHLLKMLKRLIGENIELSFAGDPDLARIYADPGQIEQILANLTINARDAMPQGGQLKITTANVVITGDGGKADGRQAEIPPGEYVRFSIQDTGTGMTADILPQIFEPFFSTKEIGKGSGLGLSTVYGIVKQHHGAILVDSSPGRGSVFSVYLPKADDVDRDDIAAVPEWVSAALGTGRILVVEDEESVRRVTTRILNRLGYEVLIADGPEEAEKIFQEINGEIDLMLTDVVMPGKNGRELYESLSALKPDLQVLFMSGYMDDSLAQKGLLGKDAFFIKKPFTSQAISEKINSILAGKGHDIH